MNSPVPSYLFTYVLSGTAAIVAAVLFGLNRALKLARWPTRDQRRGVGSVGALLVAWLLAALWLSWIGFYRGTTSGTPTIQYGVLIPIMVGVTLFWQWGALRRVIEAVPQEWIVTVQVYRVLGFIFFVLYTTGRMPGAFALPASGGDVMVGLLAPLVGIAYARRSRVATNLVRAWNWFGILDLIVALSTGLLTSPSVLQMFAFSAPNVLISAFPLAMIPVFLVPLSVLLHLASLKKLRHETGRAAYLVPTSERA